MLRSFTLVSKEIGRVGADRVLPKRSTLPDTGAGITAEYIERVTNQPTGSVTRVTVLDEHHGTAGRARLAIVGGSGCGLPKSVFAKLAPKNAIQRMMMSLFDLGRRETFFYSTLAADAPVRVPHCYAVELDERRGRNVMLLEDLGDSATFRDIREPVSLEEAGVIVDALADLHAAFWQTDRLDGDLSFLRSRDPAAERLGNMFVGRVLGNLKGVPAEVIPSEVQARSKVAWERRPEIDALWAREALTVCHGDTHLGNLFFEGDRPGFLDWQAIMASPGIRDISYFLISSMDAELLAAHEQALVDRYIGRLAEHDIEVDRTHTWTLYRATALEIYVAAVVTAGTSDRMQPPEISRTGVERVASAMQRLETFELVERLLDERLR